MLARIILSRGLRGQGYSAVRGTEYHAELEVLETVSCILVIFYICGSLFGSISTKRGGGRRIPLLDIAIHYLFSVVTFVATKFLVFIS